jgi:hypothetical protein
MASIVQAIQDVGTLTGQAPVVVGGLAVLCRLSSQHRATLISMSLIVFWD